MITSAINKSLPFVSFTLCPTGTLLAPFSLLIFLEDFVVFSVGFAKSSGFILKLLSVLIISLIVCLFTAIGFSFISIGNGRLLELTSLDLIASVPLDTNNLFNLSNINLLLMSLADTNFINCIIFSSREEMTSLTVLTSLFTYPSVIYINSC